MTVIIPTRNEASLIEHRLDNVSDQSYPLEKIEIMVVDSGSTDNTVDIAEKWRAQHLANMGNVLVIEESVRRGKIFAMNCALKHVSHSTDIVVFTDADCKWSPDALRNAAKYFADRTVGGVTCSIFPFGHTASSMEYVYRRYGNLIRVGESKLWTTPIFHGPFAAFRQALLREIGGIPTWVWADDSGPAALLGLMGYRCLAAPDIVAYELVPTSLRTNVSLRTRRARHLIHLFLEMNKVTSEMALKPSGTTKRVYFIEKLLHLLNPWILVLAMILLLVESVLSPSLMGATLVLCFLMSFASNRFRTWVLTQAILAYAFLKNILAEDPLIWEPVREIGETQNLTQVSHLRSEEGAVL
jgi:cellulose synthase/poly-beta-1,6-N-acetylglucosamine synthase-like glycosyltransferase